MRTLWCLHGNLQQPSVWSNFAEELKDRNPDLQIRLVNLWETLANSCWEWAKSFCQTVQLSTAGNDNYLLGYSLGGRLAWHALIAQPHLWRRAMIVSADVGLVSGYEKEQALHRDLRWARRFLSESWDDLLKQWDDLPVFCGRPCLEPRLECNFQRDKIARAFEVYSKGHMDFLSEAIQTLPMPIDYLTGEDDQRYGQLGITLTSQCPRLNHIQFKDAGHRVPWEQPKDFLRILTRILT